MLLSTPIWGQCICYDLYLPVCGADGHSYTNDCQARCAGVAIASMGPCAEPAEAQGLTDTSGDACACRGEAPSVCGSDGKKHRSACHARCAGVRVVSKAACAAPPGSILPPPRAPASTQGPRAPGPSRPKTGAGPAPKTGSETAPPTKNEKGRGR